MKKYKLQDLVFIAVMTAALCVIAPFSIPIPVSPVPISLATFVVYLSVYVLGQKKAAVSVVIYLLIGLVGVPVFSGFSGGPAKLLGPTGGYLIGYLFIALLGGWLVGRCTRGSGVRQAPGEPESRIPSGRPTSRSRFFRYLLAFLALVLGTAVCYALGTVWLGFQMHLAPAAALMAGVIPYIPGDIVKMAAAVIIGPQIQKQLKRAGVGPLEVRAAESKP